jgi:hypothetical protein
MGNYKNLGVFSQAKSNIPFVYPLGNDSKRQVKWRRKGAWQVILCPGISGRFSHTCRTHQLQR